MAHKFYAIKWLLCGAGCSFFFFLRGANTQIFNMDNSQCVVCVWETTKTESTCLVGQMNTGDRVNEGKKDQKEEWRTHTYARVHELMDVVRSHSLYPIFSLYTHTCTDCMCVFVCAVYRVQYIPTIWCIACTVCVNHSISNAKWIEFSLLYVSLANA